MSTPLPDPARNPLGYATPGQPPSDTPLPPPPDAALVNSATAKAFKRLLPLLFVCYIIAYVDRANVGYAKLTMQDDLPAFTNEVIGFGAGVFFWGYFLLEIPGSLLVERWSARKWIARIMITWGIIAAATAFVKTPMQFYTARFLLGLAEAGFFPGVIVYLTHWFPNKTRARAMAVFLIGTPVAQLLSPKICYLLLEIGKTETLATGEVIRHAPLLGLTGWQWVFVAWGLPAVVLGVIVLFLLPDRPRDAKWLSAEERDALERELELSRAGARKHVSVAEALRHPKVLLLALVLFSVAGSNYMLETFAPTILRDWYNLDRSQITTVLLLPPICALLSQLVIAWSSDRTRERRLHAAACTFAAALGLLLTPLSHGMLGLTVLCIALYSGGNKGSQVPFWALPSLMLTGSAAAASTGLINSIGNLGGFFAPALTGWIADKTGSFQAGFYVLGGFLVVSTTILLVLRIGAPQPVIPVAAEPQLDGASAGRAEAGRDRVNR